MSAAPNSLLARIVRLRLDACRRISPDRRSTLGQFLTPPKVAGLMARMFGPLPDRVRMLDAGAGAGTLFATALAEACARDRRPKAFRAVAYEIDPALVACLPTAVDACRAQAERTGISFDGKIIAGDFIEGAVGEISGGRGGFTHAIINPPYKKLGLRSPARVAARSVGIEASNLYVAFLGLSMMLLAPGGELVAIVPRSFCNGPYFRPFRELLLATMSLRRIHSFESRSAAFRDDRVLQENVIIHAVKGKQRPSVIVSSSNGPADGSVAIRIVPFDRIVRRNDPDLFVRLATDAIGQRVADAFSRFTRSLADLGLRVSTGRVVAHRANEHLRQEPDAHAGPLIQAAHFSSGAIAWPKACKKPNALVDCPATADLWMPSGAYVLVKRLSSKEERRRIVAAVFDPALVRAPKIAFDNHLDVVHANGRGMDLVLARGLAAFLSSTPVDTHFRQWSGHTQVNATDLRNMKYPAANALRGLGKRAGKRPSQQQIDELVTALLATPGA